MKKIASIFLIVILFYNVLGLYMMFADQKEQTWVAAMDKIDDSKFEVIKVDINPYAYVVDSGFENVNEDVVINNKTFHVFKKRIQNNVLKLYCIKSLKHDIISKDLKNIVDNQLFENSSNKENPTKKLLKSFLKDYIANDDVYFDCNSKNYFQYINLSQKPTLVLLAGYSSTHYPPPDFV